jgi:hypothetical protein
MSVTVIEPTRVPRAPDSAAARRWHAAVSLVPFAVFGL